MTLINFFLTTVTLLMVPRITFSANAKDCETTWQCPKDHYCFLKSGTCSPCTNCSIFHRQQKKFLECAKEPKECGSCLPGFEEEILTGGNIRDICLRVSAVNTIPAPNKNQNIVEGISSTPLFWLGIIFGVIFVGGFVATFHFVKTRIQLSRASSENPVDEEIGLCHRPSSNENPPPYTMKQPSAPLLEFSKESFPYPDVPHASVDEVVYRRERISESDSSVVHNATSYPSEHHENRHQNESLQKAVPFRDPDYVADEFPQNELNSTTHGALLERSERNENEPIDMSYIVDESTMPSDWRPIPSGEIHEPEGRRCHQSESSDSESSGEEPRRKRNCTKNINVNVHHNISIVQQNQNNNVNQ